MMTRILTALVAVALLAGCEPEPAEYADCDLPTVGDPCAVPRSAPTAIGLIRRGAVCDGFVEHHEPSPGVYRVECVAAGRRHLVGAYTNVDGFAPSWTVPAPDGQHLAQCEETGDGDGAITHVWREIDTSALECRPAT